MDGVIGSSKLVTLSTINKGRQYGHLTEEEITLIYIKDSKLKKKIERYLSFVDKYPDVRLLEKELNHDFNGPYLTWYIFRLIELERIDVCVECLMKLKIRSNYRTYSQVLEYNTVNKLKDFAINKLRYTRNTVESGLIPALFRVMLYYRIKIHEILDKSEEYTQILNDLVDKGKIAKTNLSRFITLSKVLNHMYIDETNCDKDIGPKASQSLISSHIEFKQGIDNFEEYMKLSYSNKYVKTTMSHIRQFLNFLFYNFPQIDSFNKISNNHIRSFVDEQKKTANEKGNINSNETINHRIEAVNRMLCYFSDSDIYNVQENVITEYEMLYEPIKYPEYYSENEILKLFQVIFNYNSSPEELQLKLALIILIDTGRRQSEVLNLSYDCLEDNRVFLNKIKHHNGIWIDVGENSIYAIKKLQSLVKYIERPIYSQFDNRTCKRLFTSLLTRGNSIISPETLANYFKKIQIENNLLNYKGNAKYTLHDLKRSVVTSMINSGSSVQLVAEYLNQGTNSLLPYEVNNQTAIKTLKKVEERGLLMGKGYIDVPNISKNIILTKFNDINIIERNKNNLIYKLNNPKEVMPLFLGSCTDNSHFDTCSDLICLSCKEFYTNSMSDYEKYALKLYRYIYCYKRDSRVKEIAEKIDKSLEHVYKNNHNLSKNGDFKVIINKIKKRARKEINDEKRI